MTKDSQEGSERGFGKGGFQKVLGKKKHALLEDMTPGLSLTKGKEPLEPCSNECLSLGLQVEVRIWLLKELPEHGGRSQVYMFLSTIGLPTGALRAWHFKAACVMVPSDRGS